MGNPSKGIRRLTLEIKVNFVYFNPHQASWNKILVSLFFILPAPVSHRRQVWQKATIPVYISPCYDAAIHCAGEVKEIHQLIIICTLPLFVELLLLIYKQYPSLVFPVSLVSEARRASWHNTQTWNKYLSRICLLILRTSDNEVRRTSHLKPKRTTGFKTIWHPVT